jgi:hypothetical protein
MNSDVMHSIVQMEPKILRQLVKEVKETVATDVKFAKKNQNSFGALKLWSIRRNGKTAAGLFRKVTVTTGMSF